jgi:hypothetical protein
MKTMPYYSGAKRNTITLPRVPGMYSPILSARRVQVFKSTIHSKPNNFMPVLLDDVPKSRETPEQVEVVLTDGTRILVTGEKSIGLFSSFLKDCL